MTWLEQLFQFSSQGTLAILVILLLCILFALMATWSILVPIVVIPIVTTVLAELELRFTGLSKANRFYFLAMVAGISLGLGEFIDIVLLPSGRY